MSMTPAPTPSGTPGWRVVAQSEVTRPGPGITTTRGVVITFQTDNGDQGTVFVPDASYNADIVRQAIANKVQLMSSVAGLTG